MPGDSTGPPGVELRRLQELFCARPFWETGVPDKSGFVPANQGGPDHKGPGSAEKKEPKHGARNIGILNSVISIKLRLSLLESVRSGE